MFHQTPARPRGRREDCEETTVSVPTPVANETGLPELAERREAWAGRVGGDRSSDWQRPLF